jgi:hypothetical protein
MEYVAAPGPWLICRTLVGSSRLIADEDDELMRLSPRSPDIVVDIVRDGEENDYRPVARNARRPPSIQTCLLSSGPQTPGSTLKGA